MFFEWDFHRHSLAFAMVCVSSLTLLCLASSFRRLSGNLAGSLRAWIYGTALVVLSDVAFVAGLELPHLHSLLIILVGFGCAEWLHAVRLFGGKENRVWWPYPVILVAAGLSVIVPDFRTQVVISSISLATVYFGTAVTAARITKPAVSIGRAVLASTFLVIGIVLVIRVGIAVSGIDSGAPPGFTSWSRSLLFVISSMGPVAGSLAFVMMCNDRFGEELIRLATVDSLTGILNRRSFLEETDRVISACRRREEPFGFLAFDLDNFKNINDCAGHPEGDRVLAEVSRIFERALRAGDLLGRIGGEEFGIAAPGTDGPGAVAVAERIRVLVEEAQLGIAETQPLTVSAGVAITKDTDESLESLTCRADRALYEAKNSGRNRVCLAS
ncbi:MAG: GGDEF domain-containing protein [Acidobacteriota bacterium]